MPEYIGKVRDESGCLYYAAFLPGQDPKDWAVVWSRYDRLWHLVYLGGPNDVVKGSFDSLAAADEWIAHHVKQQEALRARLNPGVVRL